MRAVFGLVFCLAATVVQAQSVYVEDLTWPEVRDAIAAGKTTAIIYAGSTEQNGPHMAIGKHTFIAHYVAGRIAQTLGDALVFPILPFALTGDTIARTGHMQFPGSVSLASATFTAVVREIALSAIDAGFTQVFLMGDHGGGQDELKLAAEALDVAWAAKGVRVRYVPDLYYKTQEQTDNYLVERKLTIGAHAGAEDTSQLMAIDADHKWIRLDKLAASGARQQSVTGVFGDPTTATAEMGRVFLDFKVQAAVSQIRSLRNSAR